MSEPSHRHDALDICGSGSSHCGRSGQESCLQKPLTPVASVSSVLISPVCGLISSSWGVEMSLQPRKAHKHLEEV